MQLEKETLVFNPHSITQKLSSVDADIASLHEENENIQAESVASLSLLNTTLSYNNPAGIQLGYITLSNSSVGLGNVENKSSATIRGELTASNVTTALGYTPVNKAGDTITGDLILQASSGNSPAIIFQRGTLTDTLNDWEIRDKGGMLYFGQRGNGSTAFDTNIYLDNSAGVHATTFHGNLEGNASTASLLKPIASTTTASASTWNIPSGSVQVWGERFSDSSLTYTSDGTTKTITDTGDLVMWLTPSATSNTATLNMRIDGTYYGSFNGSLTGHASSDLPLTGGTMTGTITFNKASDGALISNTYSSTTYNLIRNHNNGNISISASSAGLYLGYENTTFVNFLNGKMSLNSQGNLTVNGHITATLSGTTDRYVAAQNNNGSVCILASTNRGLYDLTSGNTGWIIYTNGTNTWLPRGDVYIPNNCSALRLYLNSKLAMQAGDTWLRINDTGANTSGVYFGTSVVRTDNYFRCGGGASENYSVVATSNMRCYGSSSGAAYFNAYAKGASAAYLQASAGTDDKNAIWIEAYTSGRATLGTRRADGTSFDILNRANNSNAITAAGDWTFSSGVTTTGNVVSTTSSGERQVCVYGGSPNRIYMYANSDGRVGLYSFRADGTACALLSRPNNSSEITAGGTKWNFGIRVDVNADFYFNDYTGTLRKPVASISGAGYRVAYLQSNANNTLTVSGNWGMTDGSLATRTVTASSSDIRLKTNIALSTVQALDTIQKISVKSFDWVNSQEHWNIGMVADELEQIDPLLAIGGGYNEDGSMNIKSINTFYLQGYIIKGIQELSSISSSHEDRITQLERENKKLKEQLSLLMSNV